MLPFHPYFPEPNQNALFVPLPSLRKWFMSHTLLAAPPEIYFSWIDFPQPFQSGSAKTHSLLQDFSKGLDNVYFMPRHQACDRKKSLCREKQASFHLLSKLPCSSNTTFLEGSHAQTNFICILREACNKYPAI